MLGWRRSGFSPTPSAGTKPLSDWKGDSMNTSSPAKNVPKPSRTAVA